MVEEILESGYLRDESGYVECDEASPRTRQSPRLPRETVQSTIVIVTEVQEGLAAVKR